jgi:hypothetical protein
MIGFSEFKKIKKKLFNYKISPLAKEYERFKALFKFRWVKLHLKFYYNVNWGLYNLQK